MNAAVVDTDVVSMFFKGDTRAFAFRKHITGRLLGISFMTLAELERWPLERAWGLLRKIELERHLAHYTVLPVNRELCRQWAEISFDAKRQGQPIQTADAWIAASERPANCPPDHGCFETTRIRPCWAVRKPPEAAESGNVETGDCRAT